MAPAASSTTGTPRCAGTRTAPTSSPRPTSFSPPGSRSTTRRAPTAAWQVLPGSHKRLYPHETDPDAEVFAKGVDPASPSTSYEAVDIELRPGQFIFFNESTLHASPPNRSETRRFGITPRITVPFVDVGRREEIDVLMLKGEDYMGYYNAVAPPGER